MVGNMFYALCVFILITQLVAVVTSDKPKVEAVCALETLGSNG